MDRKVSPFFHSEGSDLVAAQVDLRQSFREEFQVGRHGKMAKSTLRVEFDHQPACLVAIAVLPGDDRRLLYREAPEGPRLKAKPSHHLMRRGDVSLADDDIQVVEFTQSQIAIGLRRQHRALVRIAKMFAECSRSRRRMSSAASVKSQATFARLIP